MNDNNEQDYNKPIARIMVIEYIQTNRLNTPWQNDYSHLCAASINAFENFKPNIT